MEIEPITAAAAVDSAPSVTVTPATPRSPFAVQEQSAVAVPIRVPVMSVEFPHPPQMIAATPLIASLAAIPQVAAQRAAELAARPVVGRFPARAPSAIQPPESVDAVVAIGDLGDDATRRDKHSETPDDPREHVDLVA